MRLIYPHFTWRKSEKNTIYLTFDDGPIPDVTEFVLEKLKQYNAKATFFCIGDNVAKHPSVFNKIIEANHAIGNHTFNHLNGWKTEDTTYLKNIEQCKEQFSNLVVNNKSLFRPPYGRIKRSQAKALLPDYEIVMWDVLTGDYSQEISPEKCLNKTLEYTQGGSIVLFHDSIKASKNMMYTLPRVLEHFHEKGFVFDKL